MSIEADLVYGLSETRLGVACCRAVQLTQLMAHSRIDSLIGMVPFRSPRFAECLEVVPGCWR